MKNFLFALFTNRFGIVLSTANLLYLIIKTPLLVPYPRPFIGRLFIAVNSPALIASLAFDRIVLHFFPSLSVEIQFQLASVSTAVFIVLQWLLIALLARKLRTGFRPETFSRFTVEFR